MGKHPFWGIDADDYTLSIDLGAPSDERARLALEVLWEHPAITGPFEFLDRPPSGQPVWTAAPREVNRLYRGAIRMGVHEEIPCRSILHRFDSGASDVLDLSLGSQVLSRIHPSIDNPDAPPAWRPEVDAVLVSIARHIHGRLPYSRALIGWEILAIGKQYLRHGVLSGEDGVLHWRPAPV